MRRTRHTLFAIWMLLMVLLIPTFAFAEGEAAEAEKCPYCDREIKESKYLKDDHTLLDCGMHCRAYAYVKKQNPKDHKAAKCGIEGHNCAMDGVHYFCPGCQDWTCNTPGTMHALPCRIHYVCQGYADHQIHRIFLEDCEHWLCEGCVDVPPVN